MNYHQPDLTLHPPRGARAQLGGLVVLPRMIDKCRAALAGKNGEYHYNCPLDQRLLTFLGVDAEGFKAEVAKGLGDGALLERILAHSTTKPSEWEIIQWSAWQSSRAPSDADTRDYFTGLHRQCGPQREDIVTWFDLLDLDDYASYGGVV